MKSQLNAYAADCKFGREHAARVIDDARATDNLPALVRQIRECAAGDDGFSVGFGYAVAESAMRGSN